jgi:hypothetical protein
MALSRIDLAVIAVVAGGLLWVEHAHRVVIATPAAAEVALPAICPDTDSVPFSADCLKFIEGGAMPELHVHWPAPVPEAQGQGDPHGPACPASNENAPYSARCIKFLSGWYWHANVADDAR